mgnify:CR=1 FL=1
MSKWKLKRQIQLRPEVKEKLEKKKEKALSPENLTKVGSIMAIGSGAAGIILKGIKIKKELKS